jgi:hypothetical protein
MVRHEPNLDPRLKGVLDCHALKEGRLCEKPGGNQPELGQAITMGGRLWDREGPLESSPDVAVDPGRDVDVEGDGVQTSSPHALRNSTRFCISSAVRCAIGFSRRLHVFAHRVLLLTGEHDAGVRFVVRQISGIEFIEIGSIKAAQHTPLGRGKLKMSLICMLNHRGVQSSLHIDATGAERVGGACRMKSSSKQSRIVL